MQSSKPVVRGVGALIAMLGLALLVAALASTAVAATYPAGGGAFTADAEGWQATEAECNVTVLSTCEASGAHDAANGNPPGALTAKTTVLLNLAALFESTVVLESPDFTVAETGTGTMHADRQLAAGGLLTLSPEATYSVSLIDRGSGTPTEVLEETLDEGDASFAGEDGVASVSSGHTYAISIEVATSALAALGVLGGEAKVRFDNVALSTEDADDDGAGEGGQGSGGAPGADGAAGEALDASGLRTLVRRGDAPGALAQGRQVFVRLRCPQRAGHACRITAQGKIRKRVRVTQRRTVRIAQGRSRVVALRIKPRFRERIASRKRLLVFQRVRVGAVTTTFARSRALIQR